jgi:hypothetical protein
VRGEKSLRSCSFLPITRKVTSEAMRTESFMDAVPLNSRTGLRISLPGALPSGHALCMYGTDNGYVLELLDDVSSTLQVIASVELAVDEGRVLGAVFDCYPRCCHYEVALAAFLYGETSELSIARCRRQMGGELYQDWKRMCSAIVSANHKLEGLLVPGVTINAILGKGFVVMSRKWSGKKSGQHGKEQ